MNETIQIEACVNSVQSAIEAERGGAHRVELCDNLIEGGTTPSGGCIDSARRSLRIGLNAIVRPRGGDFCYSEIEFDMMKRDVSVAKELGCDGVVIGLLKPDGHVDTGRCLELIALARPMSVTFHRAFDMTCDPFQALDDIIQLGFNRILTSGQKNKAIDGVDLIAELVERAEDSIVIMPGSGVNEETIEEIIQKTRAKEYHVTCRKTVDGLMTYRNPHVSMGGVPGVLEYGVSVTDAERIERIVRLANHSDISKETWTAP